MSSCLPWAQEVGRSNRPAPTNRIKLMRPFVRERPNRLRRRRSEHLFRFGRVARNTPYSADFLRQSARSGKIRAYKLHRDWLTTPDAVCDSVKSQTKRHEKPGAFCKQQKRHSWLWRCSSLFFHHAPSPRSKD